MPRPVDTPTQAGGFIYRISKTFQFSASHQLHQLPEGHKCRRMHGHSYSVTLILQSETLDGWDFVKDYGALSTFREWVNVQLDHRHLNDPTAENIAKWVFDRWAQVWPELVTVRVSESPNTWAEYSNKIQFVEE
jgi:6-pyruvoyltetrahydropterin/6-carboxytetrahydropterin synthase